MGNKYIIEGASFNGDGTSPAEATSNGSVGAWNTITYFEGATPAYGSIAAGDIVYIRSKTSAGADIARTLAASSTFGSANATTTDPVTFVLDGGNVWPGIDGTLTYTSSNFSITLRDFNNLLVDTRGAFVVVATNSNAGLKLNVGDGGTLKNCKVDATIQTANGASFGVANGTGIIDSPIIKVRRCGGGAFTTSNYSAMTVIDPDIEFVGNYTDSFIASAGSYGGKVTVLGGRVYGVGAAAGVALANIGSAGAGNITFIGTDIPQTVKATHGTSDTSTALIEFIAADSGVGAMCFSPRFGSMDSRSDGWYPVLNALLPTSTPSGWSWKVNPLYAKRGRPFVLPSIKLKTDASAVQTLTCQFLVADTFSRVNTDRVWISVEYVEDSTGKRRNISSRTNPANTVAVASSTAPWSATTYGPTALLKKQIQVTTPTAVKQDTTIVVTFFSDLPATNEAGLLFVCPDVVMS